MYFEFGFYDRRSVYFFVKVDVSDYEKVQQLQKNIENDVGPVDILVNNAGLLTNVSLLEGKADEIQRVVNVNLTGYLWVSLA